jgi:hypothetical protein
VRLPCARDVARECKVKCSPLALAAIVLIISIVLVVAVLLVVAAALRAPWHAQLEGLGQAAQQECSVARTKLGALLSVLLQLGSGTLEAAVALAALLKSARRKSSAPVGRASARARAACQDPSVARRRSAWRTARVLQSATEVQSRIVQRTGAA